MTWQFAKLRALPWPEQAALMLLLLITLLAAFAPALTPYDPMLRVGASFLPPSLGAHPFGTDEIGRDLLSRVILGVRLTWLPACAVIACSVAIGSLLGAIAALRGGVLDALIDAISELFLVMPATLIAFAVVASLGPGTIHTILALCLFWWPWYARIVRAELRAVAGRPHVEAARLAGASQARLLVRYMLPAATPVVAVTATLDVANVVLVFSMFSFLGLGAPAPNPELGALTSRNLIYTTSAWWIPVIPAGCVFLLSLSANLAGDGLRSLLKVK
jgi:peptide/nickel transport system permease protein